MTVIVMMVMMVMMTTARMIVIEDGDAERKRVKRRSIIPLVQRMKVTAVLLIMIGDGGERKNPRKRNQKKMMIAVNLPMSLMTTADTKAMSGVGREIRKNEGGEKEQCCMLCPQ
jgi:hypothetical protein